MPTKEKNVVSQFLATLSPEDSADWKIFLKPRPTAIAMYHWLESRGYTNSYRAVAVWRGKNILTGKQAAAIHEMAAAYEGLDPEQCLIMVTSLATTFVRECLNAIQESNAIGVLAAENPEKLLQLLPSLLRESRAASSQLHRLKRREEDRNLILCGANAMAEKLRQIFKDTAMESALATGIEGATLEIEVEA